MRAPSLSPPSTLTASRIHLRTRTHTQANAHTHTHTQMHTKPRRTVLSTARAGKRWRKHNYHQTTPSPWLRREFFFYCFLLPPWCRPTEGWWSNTPRFTYLSVYFFIFLFTHNPPPKKTGIWKRANKIKTILWRVRSMCAEMLASSQECRFTQKQVRGWSKTSKQKHLHIQNISSRSPPPHSTILNYTLSNQGKQEFNITIFLTWQPVN